MNKEYKSVDNFFVICCGVINRALFYMLFMKINLCMLLEKLGSHVLYAIENFSFSVLIIRIHS